MSSYKIFRSKLIILFLLTSSSIVCFAKSEIEIKSGSIENYQTQVELLDLGDELIFKINILNDLIWSKILGENELRNNQLKSGIIKKLSKIYPTAEYTLRVQKQLKHPFFKKHEFYFIDSSYSSRIGSRPAFTLAFNRQNNHVYNFQHYEWEITKLIFDGIKKEDIKNFNEILKNEKVKIETLDEAIDICVLFVNIAYESMLGKIMLNTESVKINHMDKIKDNFKPPSFIEYNSKYKINLFCERLGYSFSQWEFEVFKNGRINLVSMREIH